MPHLVSMSQSLLRCWAPKMPFLKKFLKSLLELNSRNSVGISVTLFIFVLLFILFYESHLVFREAVLM